jgi:hypothetical protein
MPPGPENNVHPFPRAHRHVPATPSPPPYIFTEAELEILCRWYSALSYAFPRADVFLVISHKDAYSMVGVTSANSSSSQPAGMLFKHLGDDGQPLFAWITEGNVKIGPTPVLSEITDLHIRAAGCPLDEGRWLNRAGRTAVLQERTVYEDR